MFYLINWCDDWFYAIIRNDYPDKIPRCRLQGADNPRLESHGFSRSNAYPTDKHYYQVFEDDPGFTYFDTLTYQGCPIGIRSIAPSATPREALACTGGFGVPPEPKEWEHDQRDGDYHRYLRISDIDKEEATQPDWKKRRNLGKQGYKKYLIRWKGHWFWAVIRGFTDIAFRCRLQGGNAPHHKDQGFKRGRPGDPHYYKFFKTDPGFAYYQASYKGTLVNVESIGCDDSSDTIYASVYVYPPRLESPFPEDNEWQFVDPRNSWEYVPRLRGWYRHLSLDALDLEELHAPDWDNINS